ncbi:MAG: HDOD domain-containing protein [Deltaproteobacteria bacterium]|nr:HDOD domain-containing protein [Deltaproteobacteria bacterium]
MDDEPLVLRSVRRLLALRQPGWDVAFAESGTEALELVARGPAVDAVVSDMNMPGMSGAALLARIQAEHPATIRIVLSGQSDPVQVFRAVPSAHQFIRKPFEAGALEATIAGALAVRARLPTDALRALVGGAGILPAPPSTYLRLTHALSRDETSLAELVPLVESDVALTARLLQIGASPVLGLPRGSVDLLGIVLHLGVDALRALVLGFGLAQAFPVARPPRGLSLGEFEAHSLCVGGLARTLLRGDPAADDALLAGVLHDSGRLLLAAVAPARFAEIDELVARESLPPPSAELRVLGVTHAGLAAALFALWGIPIGIVEAVETHHGTPDQMRSKVARAVHVANRLAHDPDVPVDAENAAGIHPAALDGIAAAALARARATARDALGTAAA